MLLVTVQMGKDVIFINQDAFSQCYALQQVYSNNPIPPSFGGSNVFYGINTKFCNLYVPEGNECAYKLTSIWGNFNIINLSPCPCPEYDDVRESEHFIFEIPCQYLLNRISPIDPQRWLTHLDEVYEAYGELMGDHYPCNGEKIRIVEVSNVSCWAAAPIGGFYIYWSSDNGGSYITSSLEKFVEFDDWCFGMHYKKFTSVL